MSYFNDLRTIFTNTAPTTLVRIAQTSMFVVGARPTKASEITELIAPPARTAASAIAKLGWLVSAMIPPSGVAAPPCTRSHRDSALRPEFCIPRSEASEDSLAWLGGQAGQHPHPDHGTTRTEESACRAGGRHRDRQGCRSRREHERDPRDHGPERLGQVDARLRTDGPP